MSTRLSRPAVPLPAPGSPPWVVRASKEGRPLRVVFAIDNMQIGGTELNAVRLAEHLDRERYDVRVACWQEEGPLLERYRAAGIAIHTFPLNGMAGGVALRQGVRLARLLREQRVDVFHAHDIYSGFFGVPWARAVGVPTIASRRWWGDLYPGRRWRWGSRIAYRIATATVANSPRVADLLVQEGVPRRRITVLPNFLDEAAFTAPTSAERLRLRSALGLGDGTRCIGIVANLTPVKDHASLFRTLALLRPRWPELRLVLVGDGECRAALAAQAEALGITEQVVFAGRRPSHPNLHHLFEISVLCSTSEALSNAILEAMAAGRPVVATDVGASADAVVDGETGLLVPPADPNRLADAIEALLRDPAHARAMGAKGRERARRRYSAGTALAALEELYQRLAVSAVARPRLQRGRS